MKRRNLVLALVVVLLGAFTIGVLVGRYSDVPVFGAQAAQQIVRPLFPLPQAIDLEALETHQFLTWTLDQVALIEDLLLEAMDECAAGSLTLEDLENHYLPADLDLLGQISESLPVIYSMSFECWEMFFTGVQKSLAQAALFTRHYGTTGGTGGTASYLRNAVGYLVDFRQAVNLALTSGSP